VRNAVEQSRSLSSRRHLWTQANAVFDKLIFRFIYRALEILNKSLLCLLGEWKRSQQQRKRRRVFDLCGSAAVNELSLGAAKIVMVSAAAP